MDQRIQSLNSSANQNRNTRNTPTRQQVQNQQGNTTGAGRTIGSRSDYAITRSPSAIHVGDLIRGEITDLRNNEISITLEDNTTIRGQISDSSSFSIGQTGTFKLTQILGSTLTLENISVDYTDSEIAMINKALDEAGLPFTKHNQAAVKALMDNMMPISRLSIQNLMQQSYDYKTEDMNTLAVMNRLMMDINEDTVEQFSNYRNDNYQLLAKLQNFSKDIPALLHTLSEHSPSDAVVAFGKELLSISLTSEPSVMTMPTLNLLPVEVKDIILQMLSHTPLTDDVMSQMESGKLSLQDTISLLRDSAMDGTITLPAGANTSAITEQLNLLQQVLEPSAEQNNLISEDFVKNIITLKEENIPTENENNEVLQNRTTENAKSQQTADLETAKEEKQPFGMASKFFQNISSSAKNAIADTLDAFRQEQQEIPASNSDKTSAIHTLVETYEKYAKNNDLLNTFLSHEERNILKSHLEQLPVSKTLLHHISTGEATAKDVLTVIYNTISLSDNEQIKTLFQSNTFEKLFSKVLNSNWTVTPEQLSKENPSLFYSKMHTQISRFQNLIQSSLSGSDSDQLGQSARDMQSNIDFLKTLNETFSYFQLPLKLPNQDAHADLYVYTQKENLKNHPDRNSVLLHLDLEHLGKIDVRIERNKNDVITNFSLNGKDSVNLFQVNTNMLKNALNHLGYSCQIQIQEKDSPSPNIDNFINTKVNTHATDDMKRFSFDIRA